MTPQPGDQDPGKFSYLKTTAPLKKQLDCHMTYTSQKVHDLLKEGFDRSPMFNGAINSAGPRYCPSIDDINKSMGKTIGKIVEGLTKISHLKKDKNFSLQAENYRKMLLTLNDDIRVIIIKIADRLHNMQTLNVMTEEKQTNIHTYIHTCIHT